METKRLNCQISVRRHNKLFLYAAEREKTVTDLVEDWIDSLSEPKGVVTAAEAASHSLAVRCRRVSLRRRLASHT